MYIQINENDFIQAFDNYNRSENFSIDARRALFDYLCELEESCNPIELDVIAICCDYSEATFKEIADDYGIEYDDDTLRYDVLEYLDNHTMTVAVLDDTVVYQQF